MDYRSLFEKTVVELRALAKEKKVKLAAGLSKSSIIERLLEEEQATGNRTAEIEKTAEAVPEKNRRERPSKKKNEKTAHDAEKADVSQKDQNESAPETEPEKADEPTDDSTALKDEKGTSPEAAKQAEEINDIAEKIEAEKEEQPKAETKAETAGEKDGSPDEKSEADRASGENETSASEKAGVSGSDARQFRPVQGEGRRFTPRGVNYASNNRVPREKSGEELRLTNAYGEQRIYQHPYQPRVNSGDNSQSGEQHTYHPRYNSGENTQSGEQSQGYYRRRETGYYNAELGTSNPAVQEMLAAGECSDGQGVLEIQPDNYGILRADGFYPSDRDVYVSNAQIRRFNLKNGDLVVGKTRPQREGDRYSALFYIVSVNGETPDKAQKRTPFEDLTPIYPDERIRLENAENERDLAIRSLDLVAPIGKGQRGLIVSQPKAGKTVLLKKLANAITRNNPEIKLFILLIDERPEEVTDMKRSTQGEVVYSTFDEEPENHTRVAEMVLERAQRLVEMGQDVVILLDSITRLARAYNLVIQPTGRSLSGGMDPGALYKPKRFFGAARNIENGGSLTIIATALIETGSRMDDVIYEEFKGTGNMELHLDRSLSERRIFPAIDMLKSGTRRDELLLTPDEQEGLLAMRRIMSGNTQENTEQMLSLLEKSADNAMFIEKLKLIYKNWEKKSF